MANEKIPIPIKKKKKGKKIRKLCTFQRPFSPSGTNFHN